MRLHRIVFAWAGALLCCSLVAGCGGGDKPAAEGAQGEEVLPKPAAAGRSVTGMPDPGVASPLPDATLPATAQAPDIIELPEEVAPGDVEPTGEIAAPGDAAGNNPDLAVSAVRDYYAAINARDYDRAYRAWGDGGRASGQTAQQFAAGFAATAGVSVELGGPGPVEGAAGSRYVQVPVAVEARQADGSVRRFAGSYTLRMSVVDGATPEQRSWRIASADLREVRP